MPSDRVAIWFRDIIEACDRIERWSSDEGGAEAAVLGGEQVRSAIERQILIISEAAHRLDRHDPDLAPALAPTIDWSGVRGVGNFIRHRYDEIDAAMIIAVIENRLDELRSAFVGAVEALSSASD